MNKYCERQLEKWNIISIAQHNYCPSFRAKKNMRAVINKNVRVLLWLIGYLSFTFPHWFVLVKWRKKKMAEEENKKKKKKMGKPSLFVMRLNNKLAVWISNTKKATNWWLLVRLVTLCRKSKANIWVWGFRIRHEQKIRYQYTKNTAI